MRTLLAIAATTLLLTAPVPGLPADQPSIGKLQLEKELQTLQDEDGDHARLQKGRQLVGRHFFSSQQVKAMAMRFSDDESRLEFAVAAFPRTVDPENFYVVYDAFTKFSVVFRLHDRVRPAAPPPPVFHPQPVVLAPVSEKDFRDMLKAIRNESFDKTRQDLARQIIGSSRGNFLSSQIKQIVNCMDFEPGKLAIAKFAYDYVLDPENYYLVQEAFSFSNSRQQLSAYLQERVRTPRGAPPGQVAPGR